MRISLAQLPVQQPSKFFSRAATVARGREAMQTPSRRDTVELSGKKQGKKSTSQDGRLSMMQEQLSTLKQRRKELVSKSTQDSENLGVYKEQIKDIDKQLADVGEQISQYMLDQMTKREEEEKAKGADSQQGQEKTAVQLEAEQMGAMSDAFTQIQRSEQLMANKTSMEARLSELSIAERNDAGLTLTAVDSPASRQSDMSKLSTGIHTTEVQAAAVNETADARSEQAGALGEAKAEAEAADEAKAADAVTQGGEVQPEGALSAATDAIKETVAAPDVAPESAVVAQAAVVPEDAAVAVPPATVTISPAVHVARLVPNLRA